MSATFDATTTAEYTAASTAAARSAVIVAALTGTISVKVFNGSNTEMGSGTMAAPWATASDGTVTVGEVTSFTVGTTATPDADWYIRFQNAGATRWARGSFGLAGSGQNFTWSLDNWTATHTGTIGTATILTSGNAAPVFTVAPTVASITLPPSADIGHYIAFEEAYFRNETLTANKDFNPACVAPGYTTPKPGVKGVQMRWNWIDLEPDASEFYFTDVVAKLDLAQSKGLKLIVLPIDRTFNATNPVPTDLQASYSYYHAGNGWMATRWLTTLATRFRAMHTAMAAAIGSHPALAGIGVQETSTGLSTDQKTTYSYTPEAYRDALSANLLHIGAAFPAHKVFFYQNFLEDHNSYLNDVITAVLGTNVVMGGPDILPDSYSLTNNVYPRYSTFRNRIEMFCAAQFDSYRHTIGGGEAVPPYWAMNDIFTWARDNLNISYCMWNWVKSPSPSNSRTFAEALAAIAAYPNTWGNYVATGSGSVQFTAVDPDGDAVVYSLPTTRNGITINSSTGLVTATSAAAATTGNIVVQASDGEMTASTTCAVTVASSADLLVEDFSSSTWYEKWHNPNTTYPNYSAYTSTPARCTRVTASNTAFGYAPNPNGSGNALRVMIPEGTRDGTNLSFCPRLTAYGQNPTEMYLEYYLRLGSTWNSRGTTTGKFPGISGDFNDGGKGLDWWSDGMHGWSARSEFFDRCTAPDELKTSFGSYLYFVEDTDATPVVSTVGNPSIGFRWDTMRCDGANAMVINTWYKIKVYCKANTGSGDSAQRNGICRGWLNDVQRGNHEHIMWTRNPAYQFIDRAWMCVYHGGGELAVAPADLYVFIADVRVWVP